MQGLISASDPAVAPLSFNVRRVPPNINYARFVSLSNISAFLSRATWVHDKQKGRFAGNLPEKLPKTIKRQKNGLIFAHGMLPKNGRT